MCQIGFVLVFLLAVFPGLLEQGKEKFRSKSPYRFDVITDFCRKSLCDKTKHQFCRISDKFSMENHMFSKFAYDGEMMLKIHNIYRVIHASTSKANASNMWVMRWSKELEYVAELSAKTLSTFTENEYGCYNVDLGYNISSILYKIPYSKNQTVEYTVYKHFLGVDMIDLQKSNRDIIIPHVLYKGYIHMIFDKSYLVGCYMRITTTTIFLYCSYNNQYTNHTYHYPYLGIPFQAGSLCSTCGKFECHGYPPIFEDKKHLCGPDWSGSGLIYSGLLTVLTGTNVVLWLN